MGFMPGINPRHKARMSFPQPVEPDPFFSAFFARDPDPDPEVAPGTPPCPCYKAPFDEISGCP